MCVYATGIFTLVHVRLLNEHIRIIQWDFCFNVLFATESVANL